MKLSLTIALSTLMLSAPAFADTVPEGVKLRAYEPVGNGDPSPTGCGMRLGRRRRRNNGGSKGGTRPC